MLNRSPLPVPGSTSCRSQLSHIRSRPGRGSTVTKVSASRGCSHHQRQARVFEADRARALRHLDVECAGNQAVRVDVPAVLSTGFQQIDPQAVEPGLALRARTRIRCANFTACRVSSLASVGERRISLRQIVERSSSWCSRRSGGLSTSCALRGRLRQECGSNAPARSAALATDLGFVELGHEQAAHHCSNRRAAARSAKRRAVCRSIDA